MRYHLFSLNRPEFLRRYHRRSNVEAMFSSMKLKIGHPQRRRTGCS